jgi:hypothetical protein
MDEASTGLEAFCLGLAAGVAMETPRPEVRADVGAENSAGALPCCTLAMGALMEMWIEFANFSLDSDLFFFLGYHALGH